MKIVLAPDSFKGNLTSLQVAAALEKGIRRVLPNAKCIKVPMADGGEGTVQSLVDGAGGKCVRKKVTGHAVCESTRPSPVMTRSAPLRCFF